MDGVVSLPNDTSPIKGLEELPPLNPLKAIPYTWNELLDMGKAQAPSKLPIEAQRLVDALSAFALQLGNVNPGLSQLLYTILQPDAKTAESIINHTIQNQAKDELNAQLVMKENNGLAVTPMLCLILRGHTAAFKALWQAKVRPVNDTYNYSEMHWAAMLLRTDMLEHMRTHGKNPTLFKYKNIYGARPKDILYSRITPTSVTFSLDGQPPQTCTQEECLSLYDKKILPCAVYDFSAHYAMRMHGDGGLKSLNTALLPVHVSKQYADSFPYSSTPPVMITTIDASTFPSLEGQKQLVTTRPVKTGELIIVYSGIAQDLSELGFSPENAMGLHCGYYPSIALDCTNAGSGAEYINDSFPNCMPCSFLHQGILQKGIVALTDLPEGTPLHYLYSSDWFLTHQKEHLELAPESLEDYLESTKNLTQLQPLFFDGRDEMHCQLNGTECVMLGRRLAEIGTRVDPEKAFKSQMHTFFNQQALSYLFANENYKHIVEKYEIPATRLLSWLQVFSELKKLHFFGLNESNVTTIKAYLETQL